MLLCQCQPFLLINDVCSFSHSRARPVHFTSRPVTSQACGAIGRSHGASPVAYHGKTHTETDGGRGGWGLMVERCCQCRPAVLQVDQRGRAVTDRRGPCHVARHNARVWHGGAQAWHSTAYARCRLTACRQPCVNQETTSGAAPCPRARQQRQRLLRTPPDKAARGCNTAAVPSCSILLAAPSCWRRVDVDAAHPKLERTSQAGAHTHRSSTLLHPRPPA